MLKNAWRAWCDRHWLIAECSIALVMLLMLMVKWDAWEAANRFCCTLPIFIAIHVIEEWRMPGGFHYQYNLCRGSDAPDRYPLNEQSDMFINLGATLLYSVLAFCPVNNGLIAMTVFFGLAESVIHTVFGLRMKRRFGAKGKRTVYGPGSATAYLYFATVGVCGLMYLGRTGLTASDLAVLAVCIGVTIGALVLGVQRLLADPMSEYVYPSAGYFQRFTR